MRITVLGKSPAWQDAGGACSGYLIEEGETALLLDCGSGVFAKLREHVDYTEVDAVADLARPRRPLPRPRPLRVRAAATPAPAAGPGRRLSRDRRSGAAPADRPARRARDASATVVGAWGDEDLIENAFAIEEYDRDSHGRGRPADARPSPRCRTSPSPTRSNFVAGRRAVHLRRRLPPVRGAGRRRARDTDLLIVEATLPRPERTGDPRPPDPRGGRRARPPRRRRAGGADPHLRRARRRVGARRGLAGLRGPGRRRRGAATCSSSEHL